VYFSLLSVLSAVSVARGTDFGTFKGNVMPRQLANCTTPCAPFLTFTECTNSTCICGPFNSTSPDAVTACTSCLAPSLPYVASNLTLVAMVCSKCYSPCNATLFAYIESLQCNDTACACASFVPVGATAIQACGTCVESFDYQDGAGVIEFAQECGITNSTTASPSASGSPSAS